ncbi:4-hydroxy-3-methylbut-2-enyl diphosphate reductase [Arcticibacterium luteifluviistationis]|uniref:4-hydroxy-3-methylbut-2-enyl diphosphate reductase n=1 Tax=Arcticibacterium luteifluviistationis TaxID=1784714 RepID=A0A2Z4G959_9BACT|nr:4-hydroxy-3-methylbut-2-enyl diphosphate reductase [Arcticibacterium luteifluviistationis]AWV97752.1 4-hydroxy-3-methylbut-2-enyl diphosphate reductase [Arcticibacterium luteifluviistationis]
MKKFEIPEIYKSSIIGSIKEQRRVKDKLKKDFSPTKLDFGPVEFYIARHFGFCYGVENAVEIAYRTLNENPDKRIFLLSEMIHNPDVNADLLSRGVSFLMDTQGNQLLEWSELNKEDIVIVPAFGTTLEIQEQLNKIGINPYAFDTTCPFVEKVWNRASQIGERGYSVIVHGKPKHEETRATFSHSNSKTPTLVIKDIKEAEKLAGYITGKTNPEHFSTDFANQYSEGFDPKKDLRKIGVVNQTTMLASETQEISEYLKSVIVEHFKLSTETEKEHFANTRDTLCYATNDNQDATFSLIDQTADLAIVVGGYNSSNTSHLVELCETKHKTYFIQSDKSLLSKTEISHFDLHSKTVKFSKYYFPKKEKLKILLTCGASCPDSVMEDVLVRIVSFFDNTKEISSVIKSMNV